MPRFLWSILFLSLVFPATSHPALAQSGASDDTGLAPIAPAVIVRRPDGGVTVRAVRLEQPLSLDGRLDEAVYRDVPAISGFIQQDPEENAPASEPTDAWIMFDAAVLYVTVRNWEREPARMVLNEMRRDSSNLIQNEHVTVTLDPFNDKRNGVLFLVNALGGMLEEAFVDERNPTRDWNVIWDARVSRFEGGWAAEMAIPFKSLRYRPGPGHAWGIQINRVIRHKNERTWLAPVPRSFGSQAVFRVSAAATLVGLEPPPLAKNLEIKPYAIASRTTDRTSQPAIEGDFDRDAGIDVKYGLTRSLTADFTVNTDFAQVEEDEQQVNLTRFNLLFPEKREFFLEGQGIFNFGGRSATGVNDTPILFFSRRIGLNEGRPVPIIAGGRLTGRVGDYTVGMVNIQTDDLASAGAEATNFTVLRFRRDVLRRSTIGALFTGRSRSTVAAGGSQTYGVDGVFSLLDNVRVDSYLARTQTPGRKGDDLSYRGSFDYNADRYGLSAEHLAVGANFLPDVGFLRRQDFRKTAASARFSPRPDNDRTIRKFYYEGAFSYLTTGTGRLESRSANAAYRIEFQNSDRFNVEYERSYELLEEPFEISTDVTIPAGTYSWQTIGAVYQLGTQRRVNGTITVNRGSFYEGHQTTVSYRGRLALATRVALEPQMSLNRVSLLEGDFTAKLLGTRVTAPLTPRMFVSALLQYNSAAAAFSSSVRFRWEYQPRSELFVVYSEGRNTLGSRRADLATRGFVVKINRLFQF